MGPPPPPPHNVSRSPPAVFLNIKIKDGTLLNIKPIALKKNPWVQLLHSLVNPFSVGTVFIDQILTYED